MQFTHPCVGLWANFAWLGLRIGGEHDGIGALFVRQWCDGLPEFFGDEWHDRVHQAQGRFQHAQQRAAGGALLCRCAGLQGDFGQLNVPVAVAVPNELVQMLCDQIEAVLGEEFVDFGFDALQFVDDPAIHRRVVEVAAAEIFKVGLIDEFADLGVDRLIFSRLDVDVWRVCTARRFGYAAVLAFAVHEYESGRVPQLVAEVAVAFTALGVEINAAALRRERGEGEAQGVGAVGRNTVREFFFGGFAYLRCGFRAAQTGGAFVQQRRQLNAVDQVHRIEDIALGFGHFFAFRVADQTVHINGFERDFAGEVFGHHDHARDPEENDVVAGHEYGGGQEMAQVWRFFRPAERGEWHERRGEPCVEHVVFATQCAGVTRGFGLCLRIGFGACDEDFALLAVPRRNLMAPPQLARDAPILDVFQPVVVGAVPVLRN